MYVVIIEFGSSGRIYRKSDILEFLPKEEFQNLEIIDFDIISANDNEVSVYYKSSDRCGNMSLRSSIWKKNNQNWQMVFHQGTKVANLPLKATLFIICGVPGSGKTTLAKKLEQEFKAVHLSEDEWMEDLVHTYYNDQIRNNIPKVQSDVALAFLLKGVNVVMDAGYWSKAERDSLKQVALNANANYELHYLKTSLDILEKRIKKRNEGLTSEFQTNIEDVKIAIDKYFEEPGVNEKHVLYQGSFIKYIADE